MTTSPDPMINQLAVDFGQYAQDRKVSRIGKYTIPQLETAVTQFRPKADKPFYRAIELRLAELKGQAANVERKREVWTDRAITFILGLISGVLIAWIVWKLKMN